MGFFGANRTEDQMGEDILLEEEFDEQLEPLALPSKAQSCTVIKQGISVIGAVCGEGVIQVEGTIEGELELTGTVIVMSTGKIKGPVSANVVRVSGSIEGNVTARDHLRLEQTGRIVGDISSASLIVEDGGCFDGRSTMLPEAQRAAENASLLYDEI